MSACVKYVTAVDFLLEVADWYTIYSPEVPNFSVNLSLTVVFTVITMTYDFTNREMAIDWF